MEKKSKDKEMKWFIHKIRKEIVFYTDEAEELEKTQTLYISFANDTEVEECLSKLEIEKDEYSKVLKIESNKQPRNLEYWTDMPALNYNLDKVLTKRIKLVYNHLDKNDLFKFIRNELNIQNRITNKSVKYGDLRKNELLQKSFISTTNNYKVKYPIFIISKGRSKTITTSKYLKKSGIPYKVVLEKEDVEKYIEEGEEKENIIVMPQKYKESLLKIGYAGGIPVRNFVQKYAKETLRVKKYWILDDNIRWYYRHYRGRRVRIYSPLAFRLVEDFVDRYKNVYLAGHQYHMFCICPLIKPIYLNTKIYSSILIDTSLEDKLDEEHLWRGKYNEDVDLTLRTLKKGLPTICYNFISAHKEQTMTMKGGNTSSIYAEKDYAFKKAESLRLQHPEHVRVIKRFKRIHHYVDWPASFSHIKLELRDDYVERNVVNEYDLKLIETPNYEI